MNNICCTSAFAGLGFVRILKIHNTSYVNDESPAVDDDANYTMRNNTSVSVFTAIGFTLNQKPELYHTQKPYNGKVSGNIDNCVWQRKSKMQVRSR